ncbi:DUF6767 domain-containing protein [Nocardioides sp. URHA0032]|uniref:DUF6767 domain-containing protein n=1 Tax=Nocardioides sp. URHA0032 TaxID=1380388 RepID=UPI00048A7A39|nr:DUF6767 domain-containing protein [Nocardioides sp. URHA0032]
MRKPVAMCPVRPGDPCSLCVPGATGPEDCPLVAEVMRDAELRARLADLRRDLRPSSREV